jgi:hypothetical protein
VIDSAASALRDAIAEDRDVAVLDMRPGRAASWAWSRVLGEFPHASVVGAPGREGSSLSVLASMIGVEREIAVDYAVVHSVLSFGAPLPGEPDAGGRSIVLIQVDPIRTAAAEAADRWLPCRPGAEAQLALAIANVLLTEGLVDAATARQARGFEAWFAAVSAATPEAVAAATAIPAGTIRAAARELGCALPAVVLSGEQPGAGRFPRSTEEAILSLNLLLGGIESGAIVARPEAPPPFDGAPGAAADELERLEDGSLQLLIVDASAGDAAFPWALAQRKLAQGATVIALSPFLAGTALNADFVVPAAPVLEATQDVGGAGSLAISSALLPPREPSVDPAWFARSVATAAGVSIAEEWAGVEDLARLRVARVYAEGRGVLIDASGVSSPVSSFGSADDAWAALAAGSRWTEAAAPIVAVEAQFPAIELATGAPPALVMVPVEAADVAGTAAVSPLLAKLYRESGLRRGAGALTVNPATARALGLEGGTAATLSTASGTARVTIATDEAVMPGVAALVIGPSPEAMGDPPGRSRLVDLAVESNGAWRHTSATLREG